MDGRSSAGELLPAGPDHRLDKLPIGVLIGALDELGEVLPPVRGFIVRTVDIVGTDRIVSGLDDVQRIEVHAHRLEAVTQRHRLGHALRLTEAPG